jgi:hypothetical protein
MIRILLDSGLLIALFDVSDKFSHQSLLNLYVETLIVAFL